MTWREEREGDNAYDYTSPRGAGFVLRLGAGRIRTPTRERVRVERRRASGVISMERVGWRAMSSENRRDIGVRCCELLIVAFSLGY